MHAKQHTNYSNTNTGYRGTEKQTEDTHKQSECHMDGQSSNGGSSWAMCKHWAAEIRDLGAETDESKNKKQRVFGTVRPRRGTASDQTEQIRVVFGSMGFRGKTMKKRTDRTRIRVQWTCEQSQNRHSQQTRTGTHTQIRLTIIRHKSRGHSNKNELNGIDREMGNVKWKKRRIRLIRMMDQKIMKISN